MASAGEESLSFLWNNKIGEEGRNESTDNDNRSENEQKRSHQHEQDNGDGENEGEAEEIPHSAFEYDDIAYYQNEVNPAIHTNYPPLSNNTTTTLQPTTNCIVEEEQDQKQNARTKRRKRGRETSANSFRNSKSNIGNSNKNNIHRRLILWKKMGRKRKNQPTISGQFDDAPEGPLRNTPHDGAIDNMIAMMVMSPTSQQQQKLQSLLGSQLMLNSTIFNNQNLRQFPKHACLEQRLNLQQHVLALQVRLKSKILQAQQEYNDGLLLVAKNINNKNNNKITTVTCTNTRQQKKK